MNKIKYYLFSIICITVAMFININVQAASANISVNSHANVSVGKTFTVNVTVSSSSAISKYDYTLNYDSSEVELISGGSAISWADKPTKSSTKSFTFKSRDDGNTVITVKNYSVTLENGTLLTDKKINVSSKTISSKEKQDVSNNFLSSLKVKEGNINPKFDKKITNYKLKLKENVEYVNVSAEAESDDATISGDGKIEVEEGVNNIEITVTAKNGAVKKYSIVVEIEDDDPIVVTINDKKYTVVKSKKTIEKMCPEGYDLKELELEDENIPVCYSDMTDFTLVGLKNSDNKVGLYIYNEDTKKYKYYNELKGDMLSLLPLIPEDKLIPDDYEKTTIDIDDKKVTAYKNGDNDKYYLIYAMNLKTGKTGWYSYEPKENTYQKYYSFKLEDRDNLIILVLGGLLVVSLIGNIVALSKKKRKVKAS